MQGVSTRKMEKLAKNLGIESMSRSQVGEMTKGLNEQVNAFRSRSLSQSSYLILWVDALYEKVRMDSRIVSVAILVVYGVDEHGQRDILAIEPMLEESEEVYLQLFRIFFSWGRSVLLPLALSIYSSSTPNSCIITS